MVTPYIKHLKEIIGFAKDRDWPLIKREFSFIKEKILYGYSTDEMWCLDIIFAEYILPRLKYFRKNSCGYPAKFSSKKEWEEILDKMIFAFELTIKNKDLYEIIQDSDTETIKKGSEGLKLFGEYFWNLWW